LLFNANRLLSFHNFPSPTLLLKVFLVVFQKEKIKNSRTHLTTLVLVLYFFSSRCHTHELCFSCARSIELCGSTKQNDLQHKYKVIVGTIGS
jgi:hypothetical protein